VAHPTKILGVPWPTLQCRHDWRLFHWQGKMIITCQCKCIEYVIDSNNNSAASNKTDKYCQLSSTRIFTPVAIETPGTWHYQAVELVQELGRRATNIGRRLQRDHLPVPAIISGFAKGELTRSRFRTRSQPASLLQPVILLVLIASIFCTQGFVLMGPWQ